MQVEPVDELVAVHCAERLVAATEAPRAAGQQVADHQTVDSQPSVLGSRQVAVVHHAVAVGVHCSSDQSMHRHSDHLLVALTHQS